MSTSKTVHDCRLFQSGWFGNGEQRQRNAGHRASEGVQECTSPKHLAPLPRLYLVRAVQEEDELMFETTASAGAKGKGVKENGSAQQHL